MDDLAPCCESGQKMPENSVEAQILRFSYSRLPGNFLEISRNLREWITPAGPASGPAGLDQTGLDRTRLDWTKPRDQSRTRPERPYRLPINPFGVGLLGAWIADVGA